MQYSKIYRCGIVHNEIKCLAAC